METRLGAWEEEEEERTTRHILVVAASTPPALGPGLMSSAANHFAGGPEAGGTRCVDNGLGRARSQALGDPKNSAAALRRVGIPTLTYAQLSCPKPSTVLYWNDFPFSEWEYVLSAHHQSAACVPST